MNSNQFRTAIMADLKEKGKAGVKGIAPMDAEAQRRKPGLEHYYCGSSRMICPECKQNTLTYSRANSNGHIWARCSTGCFAFME